MDNDILTIDQAAEYMQVSRGMLAQLRFQRKGPKYMAPTPKTIRYRKTWCDEWLEASEVKPLNLAA